MSDWYDNDTLAFGDASDIRACARVFSDTQTAMSTARPKAQMFIDCGEDVWSGQSADALRESMDGIPELLRRFAESSGQVAEGLNRFAPSLTEYQNQFRSLSSQGRMTASEIRTAEQRRDRRIDELRAQESDIEILISWAYTYRDDPEVASCTQRIERLEGEFQRLRARFDGNNDMFETAVAQAVDIISSADRVLYNNDWDKFWTQVVEPALEVLKVVLEVAAIVLMVAAMIGSGGTLAPLIVAGLLVAVSAAQIAGTAAAGREVSGDMWLDLAINVAALATLGAARYAKGAKVAAKASQRQGIRVLKGAGKTKSIAKMKDVERLMNVSKRADKIARGAEFVEGGLVAGEGVGNIAEGIAEGDGWKVAAGVGGVAAGGADLGGVGGAAGDVSRIGHGGASIVDGIGDLTGGSNSGAGTESPKDWPGLSSGGAQPQ